MLAGLMGVENQHICSVQSQRQFALVSTFRARRQLRPGKGDRAETKATTDNEVIGRVCRRSQLHSTLLQPWSEAGDVTIEETLNVLFCNALCDPN